MIMKTMMVMMIMMMMERVKDDSLEEEFEPVGW